MSPPGSHESQDQISGLMRYLLKAKYQRNVLHYGYREGHQHGLRRPAANREGQH